MRALVFAMQHAHGQAITHVDDEEAEIIIGTYEDYVVGYRVESIAGAPKKKKQKTTSKKEENSSTTNGIAAGCGDKEQNATRRFSLEQSFAVRAHSGSVRCLAASPDGSLALSAGFDEMLNLFGLKKRKLFQTSEGAINCAAFVERSHIICGSEDSNIYVYECKGSTMTQVKTLKGHKLPVTSLCVHPSGKVLLSLSKDNTMRTWNLIKGRSAFVTNIRSQAHLVCWTKDGDSFMIAANNEVYLYNTNSGILEHSIKLDKRVNSVEFITNNIFVIATDSGVLEFFDLKKGRSLMKFSAHETRIKSVKCLYEIQSSTTKTEDLKTILFATASSDGVVKLWSADKPEVEKPVELARVETGTRLTCMTSVVHKDR